MLHSGCVKRHQKSRDFVGLPMGLLREGSPKKRMNTGLLGSRSGEYGLMAGQELSFLIRLILFGVTVLKMGQDTKYQRILWTLTIHLPTIFTLILRYII